MFIVHVIGTKYSHNFLLGASTSRWAAHHQPRSTKRIKRWIALLARRDLTNVSTRKTLEQKDNYSKHLSFGETPSLAPSWFLFLCSLISSPPRRPGITNCSPNYHLKMNVTGHVLVYWPFLFFMFCFLCSNWDEIQFLISKKTSGVAYEGGPADGRGPQSGPPSTSWWINRRTMYLVAKKNVFPYDLHAGREK